jgi:isoleucyl-tRNA synthetase
VAAALRADGRVVLDVDGEPVEVGPEEVVVTETPREGWAVTSEAGESVALDLAVTPELRRAGLARDAVRTLQEARKQAGLQVTDRIVVTWAAEGELADALREHAGLVAAEVLAVEFGAGEVGAVPDPADGQTGVTVGHDADSGLQFAFSRSQG